MRRSKFRSLRFGQPQMLTDLLQVGLLVPHRQPHGVVFREQRIASPLVFVSWIPLCHDGIGHDYSPRARRATVVMSAMPAPKSSASVSTRCSPLAFRHSAVKRARLILLCSFGPLSNSRAAFQASPSISQASCTSAIAATRGSLSFCFSLFRRNMASRKLIAVLL